MAKQPKGTSSNELGRYLPDSDAKPEIEREPIQARNQRQADEKCEEIAESYGGSDSDARPTGPSMFDCFFKVWR